MQTRGALAKGGRNTPAPNVDNQEGRGDPEEPQAGAGGPQDDPPQGLRRGGLTPPPVNQTRGSSAKIQSLEELTDAKISKFLRDTNNVPREDFARLIGSEVYEKLQGKYGETYFDDEGRNLLGMRQKLREYQQELKELGPGISASIEYLSFKDCKGEFVAEQVDNFVTDCRKLKARIDETGEASQERLTRKLMKKMSLELPRSLALTLNIITDEGYDFDEFVEMINERRILVRSIPVNQKKKKKAHEEHILEVDSHKDGELTVWEQLHQVELHETFAVIAEAGSLGICYKCHEEGHLAKDCNKPQKDNKACFNCGDTGHRYRACTKPLKPALARRVKYGRWNNRSFNQQVQQNNVQVPQESNNSNSMDNMASQFMQAMMRQMVSMRNVQQGGQKQEKNLQIANEVEVCSIDPTKAIVLSEKDEMFSMWDGVRRELYNAKVDTGATVTICGPPHEHHIRNVQHIEPPIFVKVADGRIHKVDKRGELDLEVNGARAGIVNVYVVDVPEWKAFLLGRHEILRKGLL